MKRDDFLKFSASAALSAAAFPLRARWPAGAPGRAPWPPAGASSEEAYWDLVREQFPLTHERAYLNTGGLGASPYQVIEAVRDKTEELEKICETGHTDELWEQVKNEAGALLGCDAGELAFTRNTTEGINIVANGLSFRRGDEIILTTQEHVGNAFTWLALAKREGVVLRLFEPSAASDAENMERLTRCITGRTRLISIPHALTTTGTILPVAAIARLAAEKNIHFFIDGAQTAGMLPFNLHEIGCDAYATSGHKWLLGPKETGLLYVRREMLDTIRAKFVGAYSGGEFDLQKGTVSFNPAAQRYEYGTVSAPLRAGLGAAISFIRTIGIERVWKHDRMLADSFVQGLGSIPEIELLSPPGPENRSAMITIQHRTIGYEQLLEHLETYKLRTRPVTEGGLAAIRVSFHVYNSPAEVARTLEALRTVAKG
jgi:selenocysteine lyase/cysteine desulfurase